MHSRIEHSLDFKVTAITSTTVWVLVNKQEYIYDIDGALLPSFRRLMWHSPGKALNFLKKHSYHTEKKECTTNNKNGSKLRQSTVK